MYIVGVIRVYITLNLNYTDKWIYLITECTAYFYLWLYINELIKLQVKHLQVDINLNSPPRYLCNLITLFFRKPDKIDNKERIYQVFSLHEDEIGRFMKTLLGK